MSTSLIGTDRTPMALEEPEADSFATHEVTALPWTRDEAKINSVCVDLANDGLAIKGLGHAATPAAAKRVHHYLSERKKDLLHKEGTNVVFASLLIFSELTTDGQLIEGSFRLTGTALKELWETKFVVRPEK
jgi:hypothetical protein